MGIVAEEWRTLPGKWASLKYEVSNLGNIRSRHRNWEGRPCKFGTNVKGYSVVWLSQGQKKYRKPAVHRLVALAFVPGWRPGMQVNHKNGVKSDNRAENLEWVTCKQNIRHAIETGLWKPQINAACIDRSKRMRKFDDATAEQIRKRNAAGHNYLELGREYGVSWSTIMKLCTGQTYKTPQAS